MLKPKIVLLMVLFCIVTAGAVYLPTVHLTVIKVNPFENKTEICKENVSGILIEVKRNGSIKVTPKSGNATIVGEAFLKNTSECVDNDKAEDFALSILLNNDDAKKYLSSLIKSYGDLIVEFHEREGITKSEGGKLIEKVCTGELEMYPKNLTLKRIIAITHVDFVHKKLYLIPVRCNSMAGNFCIRYINPGFRNPTNEEKEFAKNVLRKKGYKWDEICIAVKQLYVKLPNGTLAPSSVMYWIVLEYNTEKSIHKAVILSFNSDNVEEVNVRNAYVISQV